MRALEGDVLLDVLNEGTGTGQGPISSSSDYDTNSYNAEMRRFRQVAIGGQEFGSSEHGRSSNESREMDPLGDPQELLMKQPV